MSLPISSSVPLVLAVDTVVPHDCPLREQRPLRVSLGVGQGSLDGAQVKGGQGGAVSFGGGRGGRRPVRRGRRRLWVEIW